MRIGFKREQGGHFTVSALVIKGDEFLLLEHRKYNKLTFPGGHMDGSFDFKKQLFQELWEETKIREKDIMHFEEKALIREMPDPEGNHIDLCFRIQVKNSTVVQINYESISYEWRKFNRDNSNLCKYVQEAINVI